MELGETVAVINALQAEGLCVICSKSHGQSPPKTAEVKEVASSKPKSQWGRVTMTEQFESDGVRETIYSSVPPTYSYQGHHCLALSSLVEDANTDHRKDRRLRLNYYLDQIGFYPNRNRNCIRLPARKRIGDFEAFWKAVDLDKPLQMHGPGHDEAYFGMCEALIDDLIIALKANCEKKTEDEMKKRLEARAKQAENYAFIKLAQCDKDGWTLHPGEMSLAERLYSMSKAASLPMIGSDKKTFQVHGHGGAAKAIVYPELTMDTGPFS